MPGDKSISHRAVLTGSIAYGDTNIQNFLTGSDCLNTVDCIGKCGIDAEIMGSSCVIHGRGLKGLKRPDTVLYAGNSGTTARLLSGILCAQDFDSSITGDPSLRRRPMDRIIGPLRSMGADIMGTGGDKFAPLMIKGTKLKGIEYDMPVASAQVKSAILYASLYAEGETRIKETAKSRDHTEIMLNRFGAKIRIDGDTIISSPVCGLEARDIIIPGDISSAAYFISASCIVPDSHLTIRNVGVNPTRTGIIDALRSMGAEIEITNLQSLGGELSADIIVHGGCLKGTDIGGSLIPRLIDEIPVLCAAAAFADGTTRISGAEELKYKESNRIKAMCSDLRLLGANVEEMDDGLIIHGNRNILHGNLVKSYMDHRIVMAMAVAGAALKGGAAIDDISSLNISFPGFFGILDSISGE